MQTDERKEFARSLATMFSVYVATVTDDMLTAWWRVLAKYELRDIRAAFTLHLTDPAYGFRSPTPADIVKHLEITMPAKRRTHCAAILNAARVEAAPHRERIRMLQTERDLGLQVDFVAYVRALDTERSAIQTIMGRPEVVAARRELEPPPIVSQARLGMAPAATVLNSIKRIANGQRD